VTLKYGLEVTQGGTIWKVVYGFLFAFYSNYRRIFSHFGDIQRQAMAWPWNLGLGSFKVIENGAVRQTMYDFLLVRHCNYSSLVLLARYSALLVENREIFIPHQYLAPPQGWPHRNFMKMFDADKTRMIGLPYGEKLWQYVKPFSSDTGTSRTDRQTEMRTDG